MRQRYSSGMPCGLSGRGGLPEAACAFFGFCLAARRRRRGGATLQARVTGLGTARKLATRFAYMALCWRFRRRGAWRGGSHGDDEGRPPSGRSLLAAARGAGAVEVPESGAEKMHGFVRRDARSRRSAGWSRSRGPSGSARAVPGARRTSPASRAFGRFSRRQARSGPAPRTPGVRARWPAPAPGRSRFRPSMISSDFELDRCVTSA